MNYYKNYSDMKEYDNQNTIAVALDIGTTKICAIAGRLDEYGRLEVLSFGTVRSEGVARGVVSNIDKTVKAIREAVEIAERNANCTFKKVHVGIAGQHIKSHHHMGYLTRTDHNAEITKDDVQKLIDNMQRIALPAGDKILHIIPQEFTVDDEKDIVDPIGMSGYKLEANFHIITGQVSASKNIMRCIEKAGLEVADLTLEPIASSSAVLSDEEKEAGVALVDIGGGTTDITIFKDNIIRHTAVIPFGGNIITEDIKAGCTVLNDQAEKLKTKFGAALADAISDNRNIIIRGMKGREAKSISEKNLARVIQARVEEIFDYVLWEIKRSGFDRKLLAGIVLTGGGALLKNIDGLVESHTGLHARIGEPIEHLAHGYSKELASPKFATAIGLLKYTIDNLEESQLSFVESTFGPKDNLVIGESIVPDHQLLNDDQEKDAPSIEHKFITLVRKVQSYTKDFFEPTPDHEL
jgi:cell division protein FtsA